MEARRAERLEAVGESIEAGPGGERRRQLEGQLRVGDHLAGQHRRVEHDALGVGLLVGDHRGAADLRAGAGRGRDRDHRRDARGRGAPPVVAPVLEVPDRPRLAGHEGDRLGGIEAAAAAERDHAVVVAGAKCLDAASTCAAVGLADVGEQIDGKVGGTRDLQHAVADRVLGERGSVISSGRRCRARGRPRAARRPAPARTAPGSDSSSRASDCGSIAFMQASRLVDGRLLMVRLSPWRKHRPLQREDSP